MRCSICNQDITGEEHNAFPVTTEVCCSTCNDNVVVPMRLYNLGNNQKEALLLCPDFQIKIIKPKEDRFSLQELQGLVDGYIEYYPSNNKKYAIIVNEEGLLMRLPFNHLSSRIYGIHAVGNVLIVPKKLLK